MQDKSINSLLSFLREGSNFLLVSHRDPDADCICSSLLMTRLLNFLGKSVISLNQDDFNKKEIYEYEAFFVKSIEEEKLYNLDYRVIFLDFHSFARAGNLIENSLRKFKNFAIIDHHRKQDEIPNAAIEYIDEFSPSTTMIIMKIMNNLSYKMTNEDAYLVFKGFAFDTGFFRHLSNQQSKYLDSIKKIMELGVSPKLCYNEFYSGASMQSRKFIARMINNTREYFDSKLCFITCSLKESLEFKGNRDTDSLFEILFRTNIEIIVFLREDERESKK